MLWSTLGLSLQASVYRSCPCRDPQMCVDALGGIQPICGGWSVVVSMFCGGLPNKVNVDVTALPLY